MLQQTFFWKIKGWVIASFPTIVGWHVNWSYTPCRTRSAATKYNGLSRLWSIIDSFCSSILPDQTPEARNGPRIVTLSRIQNNIILPLLWNISPKSKSPSADSVIAGKNDIYLIELIHPVRTSYYKLHDQEVHKLFFIDYTSLWNRPME